MNLSLDPLGAPAFTMKQLAYFAAAANEGTIVGAAELLRVSPSAMSDAITELETLLGEQLCVRRRAQGLTLTPAGRQVVEVAHRILAEADDLRYSVGQTRGELSGPIAIGCYPTLATSILPPLLQDFATLHPGVELTMIEATQDQLAVLLASGRVDLAFVYDMLVPGNPERLRLYELPAHVVLAASHPLANRASVRLSELIEEDLILLDAPPSSDHTLAVFAEQGLRPKVRHRTASFEVVRTLVARGLGYGLLVSRVKNQHSYEGLPIVEVPIEPAVRAVGVEAIWASDRPLSRRTRALLNFAQSVDWS